MTLNFALGPQNPETLRHPTNSLERESVNREDTERYFALGPQNWPEVTPTHEW